MDTGEDRLLPIPEIIGDRKRGITGIMPMSRSKFYDAIKRGIFPPLVHIGKNSYLHNSTVQKIVKSAK